MLSPVLSAVPTTEKGASGTGVCGILVPIGAAVAGTIVAVGAAVVGTIVAVGAAVVGTRVEVDAAVAGIFVGGSVGAAIVGGGIVGTIGATVGGVPPQSVNAVVAIKTKSTAPGKFLITISLLPFE